MVNYNINISRNVEVEGGVHNLHSYIYYVTHVCMYIHIRYCTHMYTYMTYIQCEVFMYVPHMTYMCT